MDKQLLGESPAFCSMLRTAGLLAPTDATVLIAGESGTGKELIAHYIHRSSRRVRGPWVSVNCAALPESLVESELFGHSKGAFTGASERRLGRVQTASNGTLFLDEISELPLSVQSKLLRFLENGECQVVGQPRSTREDVRIIAASNRNLMEMVREGVFRADLFYRLNVVPLELPPLRERIGDISILTQVFLQTFSEKNRLSPPRFSKATVALLHAYKWPGNIRELRNLCERLSILHAGKTIEPDHLPKEILLGDTSHFTESGFPFSLPQKGINLFDLEKSLISQALSRASGNKSRAALLLGLSRDTFLYRLKKCAIPV